MVTVRYVRTRRFKKAAAKLPREIQEKAAKAFMLFKENPRHPSLGVKRIQGMPGVWEGRIDIHYRFTFHYEGDKCVFRNVGPHVIVEREP
jgi:mRNA-degrading endonuclease RelE of RelBE toxin-antitoxin system